MKRALCLSIVLVLASALTAQATISLSTGDTVTFEGQTSNSGGPLYTGYGGEFTWVVASTASKTDSPVGTVFYSFCVEIGGSGSDITPGHTYTIGSLDTPVIGGSLNAQGSKLANTQGLFLFNEWNSGLITQNQANAAAVQVALWLSEGYTSTQIVTPGDGGYTSAQLLAAESQETSLLGSLGYSSSWTIGANDQIAMLNDAQDQAVYVNVSPSGLSLPVPEPATLAIWGACAGLAGATAMRHRKQPRGRWPEENRQAIFQIIEGKR